VKPYAERHVKVYADSRPSQTGLYRKLREHAMPHLARARAAALITLAAEIPAPVLADLLGLHIHTAVQWSQQAQLDWASYLNARTDRQQPPAPEDQ
jgi:hypothetical protein